MYDRSHAELRLLRGGRNAAAQMPFDGAAEVEMAGSADGVQDAACNGETFPADDHSALAARSAATLRRDAGLPQPQEPVAAEPSWAPKQVSKLIKRLSGEKGTSKLRQGESITRPPRHGGWIQIGCSRDLRPRTRNHNIIQQVGIRILAWVELFPFSFILLSYSPRAFQASRGRKHHG